MSDLAAGTNFTVQVYAVNQKGRGRGTSLRVPTLELMVDRVGESAAEKVRRDRGRVGRKGVEAEGRVGAEG